MLLMSCTDLARGYDATPLFEDVTFELYAGDRVGFVGPNGAGKTTLLKVLAGIDEPEAGAVRLHAGARLGLLSQVAEFPPGRTLFQEAKSAFDELLATQDEMVRVADQLAHTTDESERKQLSARFDRLSEQLTRGTPTSSTTRSAKSSPASGSARRTTTARSSLSAAASNGGCCSPRCSCPPRT